MKYFINPYKQYYEKLAGLVGLPAQAAKAVACAENAQNSVSKLNSSVNDSTWSELGIDEFKKNVIPALLSNHQTLTESVKVLEKIAKVALEDLYPKLGELKDADEKLENVTTAYESLKSRPEYEEKEDGTKVETQKYKDDLAKKKEEMEKTEELCKECIGMANEYLQRIKDLDSSVQDLKNESLSLSDGSSETLGRVVGPPFNTAKMFEIEVNGRKFYVANTKINALDYQDYLQDVKMFQNAGFMDGHCPILSQSYACDMMRGTFTARDVYTVMKVQRPSVRINGGIFTDDDDELYQAIYNELTSGRVGTLRVTRNTPVKDGTHVVTVVGFDASVKSYKDLNADTILVLDCVDGKLQTISQVRSEGGHERKIVKVSGRKNGVKQYGYVFHTATEDFLEQEVENDEWFEKHGYNSKKDQTA